MVEIRDLCSLVPRSSVIGLCSLQSQFAVRVRVLSVTHGYSSFCSPISVLVHSPVDLDRRASTVPSFSSSPPSSSHTQTRTHDLITLVFEFDSRACEAQRRQVRRISHSLHKSSQSRELTREELTSPVHAIEVVVVRCDIDRKPCSKIVQIHSTATRDR